MPLKSKLSDWQIPVTHYDPNHRAVWYSAAPDWIGNPQLVDELEKEHQAKFLMEYPVKPLDGNNRRMMLIFWVDSKGWLLFDRFKKIGDESFTWIQVLGDIKPVEAIVSKEGQVLFSKGRNDFRSSHDGSYAVDGGPGYERVIGADLNNLERAILFPQKGELHIIDNSAAALMRGEDENWRFN